MSGFISIDQNSHALWDTVPKLDALARRGLIGTHCIEDIDVAFTRQGAAPDDRTLTLAPERYYRSGNSDWGAALFYTEFLGRNALNPRDLETYTGLSTASLARKLGLSVDDFYSRYAGSDNWQLVGSSYAGNAQHHRVIGDLSLAECTPFIRQLLKRARANMEYSFPDADAQENIRLWADGEFDLVERLFADMPGRSLVDFYTAWLLRMCPDYWQRISATSELMKMDSETPRMQLLRFFLADYATWAGHYNAAIAETACGLKPLDTATGELPFFAVWHRSRGQAPLRSLSPVPNGLCRTSLALSTDGRLVAGGYDWPVNLPFPELLEKMRAAGVVCVSGKALLLVLQARLKPDGAPLALPYKGSLYMPAAWAFERRLRAAGLLPWPAHPVLRVRFRFLEQLRHIQTRIRLPAYLAAAAGTDILPAAEFAERLPELRLNAAEELKLACASVGRDAFRDAAFPEHAWRIKELDVRRRELARDPATRAEAGALWDQQKAEETRLLEATVERLLRNLHVLNVDYWDSRGAIQPWAFALGGDAFHEKLLNEAEITEESA